jgi:hypothetical protein
MAMRYTPEDWGQIQGQKVQDAASGVWKTIQGLAGKKGPSINDWTKMVKPSSGSDLPEWLQLQMDAIDSKYGGGGSGGGGGFYSVPSIQPQIDNLRNFQNTGNQNIQGAYANLNQIYGQSQAATEKTGADTTAAVQKTWDDNAATQAQLAQQLQAANAQQTSYGGTAGTAAGNDVSKAAAARIAENQSNIANNKAASMASQQQYAQGMADAARQAHTVSGTDQATVTGNFNTNITNQLAQLQSQYDSEVSKANAANASASASSSSNAGKAQGAKLDALSKYLKGKDSDAAKAAAKLAAQKDPKKGLLAVMTAAKKSGHPELANIFAGALNEAQTTASQGIPILQDPTKPPDEKTNPTIGSKPISLNNALKQILDKYANSSAPAPTGKDMMHMADVDVNNNPRTVTDWLGHLTGVNKLFGADNYGTHKEKKNVLDLAGGPLRIMQMAAKNKQAQTTQNQLMDLYNYYTGQYGG